MASRGFGALPPDEAVWIIPDVRAATDATTDTAAATDQVGAPSGGVRGAKQVGAAWQGCGLLCVSPCAPALLMVSCVP